MFWLLLATGFTGALTLRFLYRQLVLLFVAPPSVEVRITNGADSLDPLLEALKNARREVLVLARSFTARPVARALVEARVRNVHVEILLDPACERERMSDLTFFREEGLQPLATAPDAISVGAVLIIDSRTIFSGGFFSPVELGEDTAVDMLCIKGYPEVAAAYRQHFANEKSAARPAEPKPQQTTGPVVRAPAMPQVPQSQRAPAAPTLPTSPAATRHTTAPAPAEPAPSRSPLAPVLGSEAPAEHK